MRANNKAHGVAHIRGIVRGRTVVPAEGVCIGLGISCQNLNHIVRGKPRQENRKGCTLLRLLNLALTPFDLELTRKVRVSCAPLPRPTISENLTCLRATEQKWKAWALRTVRALLLDCRWPVRAYL